MKSIFQHIHIWHVLSIFLGVYVLHFLADFVLTPRKLAKKFDCSIATVAAHCLLYSSLLLPYYILVTLSFLVLGHLNTADLFALIDDQLILTAINVISHAIIDISICSVRDKAFEERRFSDFWKYVGFDQMLHIVILTFTTAHYTHFLFLNYM